LIQALRATEPHWPPTGVAWLTDRELLETSADGNPALNLETADLIVRAGALDGAIILCEDQGRVKFFGRRLNYSSSDGGSAGSKRETARAFVKHMNEIEKVVAFAVAVSTDGPIYLYTPLNATRNQPDELYESIAREG
jgi:hypothetical protein